MDSDVDDNGTVLANSGTLSFAGNVFDDGTAQINNNAEIEFGLADYNDVFFGSGASGTLRLDKSATAADTFHGTIYGFAGQDKLDLSDIAYVKGQTALTFSGTQAGVLSVTDGTNTTSLNMVGPYTQGSFLLGTDGHGGTAVTL